MGCPGPAQAHADRRVEYRVVDDRYVPDPRGCGMRRGRDASSRTVEDAPDDKRLAIAAVHRQRVVAGLENLAALDGDVMPANEPDTRAAALKPQAANHQVRTVSGKKARKAAPQAGACRKNCHTS